MGKFNETVSNKTVNKCGHTAYKMDDKSKLVSMVLTSFFNESKFYGDNSSEMQELIQKVVKDSPEFVANLAVYARKAFNMRSVSHVLTAYLAHEPEGKPFTRKVINAVAVRGDDLTEIMSFYLATFGKPIPNALKKGFNDVLEGFDEYTIAKYKGEGKSVKMRDLLCLCRPTPKNDEQSAMWKRCLEGKLETPVTWETELSANGNTAETWEKLIDSGKVGYMALLRNLRNIINAEPENIQKVYETIENTERVMKSKQLPFRFLSAYKSIEGIAGSRAIDALESAVETSIGNIKKLPGTTVIAIDTSSSMSSTISAKSDIHCYEIALMLGMIANKLCENSIVYTFNFSIKKWAVSNRTGILYATTHSDTCGGGTDIGLPFKKMLEDNVKADRVIVLSDMECNHGMWDGVKPVQKYANYYRKESGCDLWVHAIDLQGYGTQQFQGKNTNIISGWSEKVFDFILLAEQGESTLVKTISEYVW